MWFYQYSIENLDPWSPLPPPGCSWSTLRLSLPLYSPHCTGILSVPSTRKLALQGQRQCFIHFGAPTVLGVGFGPKCLLNREMTDRRDLALQCYKILTRWCQPNHWWFTSFLLNSWFSLFSLVVFYFIRKLKTISTC